VLSVKIVPILAQLYTTKTKEAGATAGVSTKARGEKTYTYTQVCETASFNDKRDATTMTFDY